MLAHLRHFLSLSSASSLLRLMETLRRLWKQIRNLQFRNQLSKRVVLYILDRGYLDVAVFFLSSIPLSGVPIDLGYSLKTATFSMFGDGRYWIVHNTLHCGGVPSLECLVQHLSRRVRNCDNKSSNEFGMAIILDTRSVEYYRYRCSFSFIKPF